MACEEDSKIQCFMFVERMKQKPTTKIKLKQNKIIYSNDGFVILIKLISEYL